ncbi:MAG: LolA family protein [Acidocella sp.]|uniref:LolA family protein n=1 Tax=Acidocella sp. TaxID=50710 RepID=UPI003FD80C85
MRRDRSSSSTPNECRAAIDREPGEYDITLIRKNKAAQGTLTLVFGTNPLELRQWVVTDAQGKQTRVSLYDMLPGGPYPDSLFQYNQHTTTGRSKG